MRKLIVTAVTILMLIPFACSADNNIRDYLPAPPNTLLSLLYYYHITADDLYVSGSKAANIDFTEDLSLLREVYYFKVGSYMAAAQAIVPYGSASLDIGDAHYSSTGLGDIILLGTFWFVSDPGSQTYLGFSPYFFLPTGEYDKNDGVNIGCNRYVFREELNLTKGFDLVKDHPLYFEVTTGFDFFTDNEDYQGDTTLSQDPLFNLESHLSFNATSALVISGDYYGHWSGNTEVDGVDQHAAINTQTLGMTLSYNFTPAWQLLLQYKEDVKVNNGVEAQVLHLRVFYAF